MSIPLTLTRALRCFSICVALVAATCFTLTEAWGQGVVTREYQVKAAYLTKFLNFIEWKTPDKISSRQVVCILGESPFDNAIEQLARAYGISLEVVDWYSIENPARCHVVYVCKSERRRLDELMPRLESLDAVTVSDIPGFADRGGTIEFIIEGRHVRFIINQRKSSQGGFRLSSQLLALAKQLVSMHEIGAGYSYRA